MSYAELLAEWSALLERRPTFREALGHYAGILTAWSQWPSHRIAPLRWSVDECRERGVGVSFCSLRPRPAFLPTI
jgi:hypothetical protein